MNGQIIGVSTDSHYAHLAFSQSELGSNFEIVLASDLTTNVSKQFGVLENGHSKNCAFIVGPQKTIAYFTEFVSNIDAKVRTHQLLTTLKSLHSIKQ